jgi:hypothetical protein
VPDRQLERELAVTARHRVAERTVERAERDAARQPVGKRRRRRLTGVGERLDDHARHRPQGEAHGAVGDAGDRIVRDPDRQRHQTERAERARGDGAVNVGGDSRRSSDRLSGQRPYRPHLVRSHRHLLRSLALEAN